MRKLILMLLFTLTVATSAFPQKSTDISVTAVRAGKLIDVDAGRVLTNQVILIRNGKIDSIGANAAIPDGADRNRPLENDRSSRSDRLPHPPGGRRPQSQR